MPSALIVLPTAFRHDVHEGHIRHALANVIDLFEDQGPIPLTIVTGRSSDMPDAPIIEVGFEISSEGNVVVYHAMEARPKYRRPD